MSLPEGVEELTQTFLREIGLNLTPTFRETPEAIWVELEGPDNYLLLERQGIVLESLQLLMGKVAARQLNLAKRLVVDCEGRRRQEEEDLLHQALQAAEQVRRDGRQQELPPMNAYDRRLVHLELAQIEGVSTSSVDVPGGEGLKKIVISPA